MDLTVIKQGNMPNPVFIRDIFEPKSNNELVAEWEKNISGRTDSVVRDSIVEEMVSRDLRPEAWAERRNTETGLYPDVSDPDFSARLLRKTEFATLASKASDEDTCSQSQRKFETTAVQRLVARFLHPTTPYRGLLLNHGVGVGKTCSAITVAETFLEMIPHNTVYILAPQAIAEGFERTIFDVNRLKLVSKETFALTGERWESPQCTGMTYLRLTNTVASDSKDDIQKEVNKLIRRRYKIIGYRAFANWVSSKIGPKAIPETVTGILREDKEKEILMNLFSDHLIIIDEAHNLRDSEAGGLVDEPDKAKVTAAAEGKALTPILKKIALVSEGLRMMFMTATPMYDTAQEIVLLLNLLTLNDTKDESTLINIRDVFTSDGRPTEEGEKILAIPIKRYVSYMRGENPNTFPLRLMPPESAGESFFSKYPTISISRREGKVAMSATDRRIMEELPLIVHSAGPETRVGTSLATILERNSSATRDAGPIEISDFILDQTMQMGNITYPNGLFGGDGWNTYMKSDTVVISGTKVTQFTWTPPDPIALQDVFVGDGLASHAPKIAGILQSVIAARGISFIYSRYIPAGALPIAVALEMAGWCRVLSDGTPAPILKTGAPGGKYKAYYILLLSDESLSPDFAGLIKYATTFTTEREAYEGTKVKAIIGSQVAAEGLDLKCIREMHLLDGWYHLNRIEQIEGRGVRYCSHTALPMQERNCLIYLHVVSVDLYETADLYAYRLAVRKAQPIGRITRLMKQYAWDCMLNRDAILLADLPTRQIVDAHGRVTEEYDLHDKSFTSFCDFSDKCEYLCAAQVIPVTEIGKDMSTYKDFDFRRRFLEKSRILAILFAEEDVAIPLKELQKTVYRDIPWPMAVIGLREIFGKLKIRRKDGLYGTLQLQNGYVVFQPDRVTDRQIPIALRYSRAYGRMPRIIQPERTAIMTTEAPALPVIVEEGAEVLTVRIIDTESSSLTAMKSLRGWHTILKQIVAGKPGRLETAGLPEETFDGWRWVLTHFGSLKETIPIACQWWMDNIWSPAERTSTFNDWLVRGIGTLDGDEKMYAEQYQPAELFQGELSGHLTFDSELRTYCFFDGDLTPTICPSLSLPDVTSIIGKPIDRKADTGLVFGFLVAKMGNVVFKTVDKEKGDLKGAECANTSNLKNHERRIKIIQDSIRANFDEEDEIVGLLLEDNPDLRSSEKLKKSRQDAIRIRFGRSGAAEVSLDLQHTTDLSLKQACPFMEYVLRWMDRRRVGGKRWFLSVVQSARAGVKMS